MGSFLEKEKVRLADFKKSSSYFSSKAKCDGDYKKKPRPFCLHLDEAEENLYFEIRDKALQFFRNQNIKWHDGEKGKPSNHLCDSQICCVNFLFPWADKPDSLKKLFRRVYPDLAKMLTIEEGQYISFEWIGIKNYLKEKTTKNGNRTRGANFTSADAAVLFEKENGQRQLVLIEWKYTESYSSVSLKTAQSGTDRTLIYRWLYNASECPLDKKLIGDFDNLFYEPFYQLMRQQFLAYEMEKAKELGADIVSVLHISPTLNKELHRVTSPKLHTLGDDIFQIWSRIVRLKERFKSISTEKLFYEMDYSSIPELKNWWEYIRKRYYW